MNPYADIHSEAEAARVMADQLDSARECMMSREIKPYPRKPKKWEALRAA